MRALSDKGPRATCLSLATAMVAASVLSQPAFAGSWHEIGYYVIWIRACELEMDECQEFLEMNESIVDAWLAAADKSELGDLQFCVSKKDIIIREMVFDVWSFGLELMNSGKVGVDGSVPAIILLYLNRKYPCN